MDIAPTTYNSGNRGQKVRANEMLDTIVSDVGVKMHDIVVDIGCGTGNVTVVLATKVNARHIYGLDMDEEMIAFATQNHMKDNISYIVQKFDVDFERMAPALKALEGKVSLIFSNFCFHWFKNKELVANNLYRLLAIGGRVYTKFPNITNFFNEFTDERKAYFESLFRKTGKPSENHKEWLDAFESVGFTTIRDECIESLSPIPMNNFNEDTLHVLANIQMIHFIGTDEQRVNIRKELPALIKSSTSMSTDETTGEQKLLFMKRLSEFVIKK